MRKINFTKIRLINEIKENKLILLLFVASTIFFLYQHASSLSWDFATYVINAKYWFADGKYFEILRPPLMPLTLGLLSFTGWKIAEFLFIFITSALFAYSSIKFAKSIKFNPVAFYALSLNFYVLNYGLINGTELLSLAFLELFLAFLIEDKCKSGFFLGLSALSRYTSIAFFPLILLHMNFKKIVKSLLLFGAAILPWFIYNFYKFGNFFTSIADQYANNIIYRNYIIQHAQLSHFLQAQNILIPFFIMGLAIVLINIYKSIKSEKKIRLKSVLHIIDKLKIEIIMIFLLIYSISSYNNIPIKGARYLFNLILPTVYFSYIGINYLLKKTKIMKKQIIKIASVAITINFTIALIILAATLLAVNFAIATRSSFIDYDPPEAYISAIDKISELNLSECAIESNSWVKLNYYNLSSSPCSRLEWINNDLRKNHIIIMLKKEGEPKYDENNKFIISARNEYKIYENNEYLIMGSDTCLPSSEFNDSYVKQVDNYVFEVYRYHINTNPCFTMFRNSSLLEKTCNFVNFNGFGKDENRRLE